MTLAMNDELALPGEWVDCYDCGGRGFHEDLHEVDPLWYDEGHTEVCEICKGKGGWVVNPEPPSTGGQS